MEAEEIISLLDSHWYSQQIFKKTSCIIPCSSSPSPPRHHFQEPEITKQSSSNHKRSSSDQMMNSSSVACLSPPIDSPNSVLQEKKKDDFISRKEEGSSRTRPYYLKKKRSLSKSLSELEFEEVKGFMDLGFVFSEEDIRETSLVEIIPGLQRIIGNDHNKEENGGESVDNGKCLKSRPYLSEAWDEMEKRRRRREKENPLMNWRIPNVNDEINMKDNLKWWAQVVASTVK